MFTIRDFQQVKDDIGNSPNNTLDYVNGLSTQLQLESN
jgi:hypothetical protein